MTQNTNKGGRIPPDNRPVQAKGVGENSRRHDLERRSVPFLHGSDLQQGDVQALRQGQRVAPKQTQRPAAPRPAAQGGGSTESSGPGTMGTPDPIQFLGKRFGTGSVKAPQPVGPSDPRIDMWLRFAQHLIRGPGASGKLAGAYINQLRNLRRNPPPAESRIINLNDVDDAIEAMLDANSRTS